MMRPLSALILASVAFSAVAQPARTKPFGGGRQRPEFSQLPDLLKRAMASASRQRFSGTRKLSLKFGGDRRVHTEFIVKDGPRTRVEYPSDSPMAGQVIVDDGAERRHYFPAQNQIRIEPARREKVLERLGMMARQGRFAVADGGAIAGKPSQVVTISDKQGNPLTRLWIEPRTGITLKRELYDRTGAVVGGFEFTEINLNPTIDPRDFKLSVRGAKLVRPVDDLRDLIARNGFRDVQLPSDSGFKLADARVQEVRGTKVLVQQYVDGDDRHISLFQLNASIDPQLIKRLARNEFASVTWQVSGTTLTLVGGVPQSELSDLAKRLGA